MTFVPDECYPWVSGKWNWNVECLWHGWDLLARVSVCLLTLLTLDILIVASQRLYIYLSAKRQTRNFLCEATSPQRDSHLDDIVTLAAMTPRSPTATIFAEGIYAFASAPPWFSEGEAIHAAERACWRVRGATTAKLAIGLQTLRTIALLAPFVGLAGTCVGILNSYGEMGTQVDAARSAIAWGITEALVITAAGLFVGILTVWFHNHLWRQVEALSTEMLEAEAKILQILKAHPGWRYGSDHSAERSGWTFLTEGAPQWEVSYDRQRLLLVQVCGCGIFVATAVFLHFH